MARKPRARLVLCAEITLDGRLLDWSRSASQTDDEDDEANDRAYEFFYQGASSILFPDGLPHPHPMARSVKQIIGVALSAPEKEKVPARWRRDIRDLLRWLWNERPGDALCFAGTNLFHSLLENDLADEMRLVVHQRVDGRRDAPTLTGAPTPDFFSRSVAFRLLRMETRDGRCFLSYRARRARAGG